MNSYNVSEIFGPYCKLVFDKSCIIKKHGYLPQGGTSLYHPEGSMHFDGFKARICFEVDDVLGNQMVFEGLATSASYTTFSQEVTLKIADITTFEAFLNMYPVNSYPSNECFDLRLDVVEGMMRKFDIFKGPHMHRISQYGIKRLVNRYGNILCEEVSL